MDDWDRETKKPAFSDRDRDLKERSRAFALRIIKLVERLPPTQTTKVIGNQLLRSGTSVAANYRAACRARSTAEFLAKLGIVEEETDESIFWMELLVQSGAVDHHLVADLIREGNELCAIWVASINTARKRKR